MSRARKAAIVEAAAPDVASAIADALTTVAGALCPIAAGAHSDTEGRQREMAAVFFKDAEGQFKDVLRKMDPELQRKLESYIDGICRGKRR